MARIRENLDRGLVDGCDPCWLQPGQLSYIQNVTYHPDTAALQRAKGRVAAGAATSLSSIINGLRDCDFDNNAGHYLIAQCSGNTPGYVTSFVGDTLTFGLLSQNMTAGASLERVQHNNRFFLFNGATASASAINSNGVFYLSATAASSAPTIRQHGMIPVVTPPATATAASAFSLSVTGYYDYWCTEVAKFQQDGVQVELESTYGGSTTASTAGAAVATVFISSTAQAPVLTMPPAQNGLTTHWRIYRSAKKTFSNDITFPAGFVAGSDISILSAQFVDSVAGAAGSYAFPTTFNGAGQQYANFASASSMASDNGVFASATGITYSSAQWGNPGFYQSQGVSGFSFGGFKGFVQGIEVEIEAYSTAIGGGFGRQVSIGLMKGNAQGAYAGGPFGWRTQYVTAATPSQVITFGGSADRWVGPGELGFADSDFDTNFMVVVQTDNKHLGVDYVKVRPYYGQGAVSDTVVPFPTVVYTFGDISVQVGKNGPPPTSDTGDVYEDCLVLNDKSNPSLIRWSSPGQPEYFPATYFVDFETDNNDQVRWIKVVNNRLIVALDNSVWRVNYLPSERDASFDRGKCKEPLTLAYGAINPMCACVFSRDNATQSLAWVSQKGIHITDGYTFDTLTNFLNWRNILSLTNTSQAISLVNDPENKVLKFLYRNDGLAEPYKELQISYAGRRSDSTQVDDQNDLKICGQVAMRNIIAAATGNPASMWAVPRRTGDTSVYIGYGSAVAAGGGKVFIESGAAIPANDPNFGFTTRRMMLAGEGAEFRANEVYAYIGNYTQTVGGPGIAMNTQTIKTNDDAGEVVQTAKAVQFAGRKLGKWQFRQQAEGLRLNVRVTGNPDNDLAWDYLIIDGEGFGSEDSGK